MQSLYRCNNYYHDSLSLKERNNNLYQCKQCCSSNEQDSTHHQAKLVAYLPIGHQDTHQSHGCNVMVVIPAIQHSSASTGTLIQL